MPIRVQRKRVKGWKMPPNTVCVTRGTAFGNPFTVGGWFKMGNGKPGMAYLQCYDEEMAKAEGFTYMRDSAQAVGWFRRYRELYPYSPADIGNLRGKNVACFCGVGDPCHGDVLLEIANK